ncbi:uncharacterized protein LOC136081000 [Hydra vulgaris]|uniref:Uncharacterized protein LOC136081000 n=1 Tax=Hydra vulgaris TaxID=6087 RepID=A0ABM4BYV2_HYDVU
MPWLKGELFQNQNTKLNSTSKTGRPEKEWIECSLKTKRRKVSSLAKTHTTEELAEAAVVRAKLSPGKSDLGENIKMFSKDLSGQTYQPDNYQPAMMSADQALSLVISLICRNHSM